MQTTMRMVYAGVLLCFALLAHAADLPTAEAMPNAMPGPAGEIAPGTQVKTTDASNSSCCKDIDPKAEAAFWAYILTNKCEGPNEAASQTQEWAALCYNLAGALCSMEAVVKCSGSSTDFLKDGKVVATGNHKTLQICDPSGACRGQ